MSNSRILRISLNYYVAFLELPTQADQNQNEACV